MMDAVSATETEVITVWDLFGMKLRHFAREKSGICGYLSKRPDKKNNHHSLQEGIDKTGNTTLYLKE